MKGDAAEAIGVTVNVQPAGRVSADLAESVDGPVWTALAPASRTGVRPDGRYRRTTRG